MRAYEILEARRNPEQNPKVSALDSLKKYKGRDDVYVSFTDDVGTKSNPDVAAEPYNTGTGINAKGKSHNSRGSKIGINPKYDHGTPLGIYAYPISYVLDRSSGEPDVPYAADRPYIQVIRSTGNMLDLQKYSQDDLENDCAALQADVPDVDDDDWKEFVNRASYEAKVQSPGGYFFNICREFPTFEAQHLRYTDGLHEFIAKIYLNSPWSYKEVIADRTGVALKKALLTNFRDSLRQNGMYDQFENTSPEEFAEIANKFRAISGSKPTTRWSKVFQGLGYDGLIDNGDGIIHQNEPTQALFFNKKSFSEVETIHNITYSHKPYRVDTEWYYDYLKFAKYLEKHSRKPFNEEEVNLINSFIWENPEAIRVINWNLLPESIRKDIRVRWYEGVFDPKCVPGLTQHEIAYQVMRNPSLLNKIDKFVITPETFLYLMQSKNKNYMSAGNKSLVFYELASIVKNTEAVNQFIKNNKEEFSKMSPFAQTVGMRRIEDPETFVEIGKMVERALVSSGISAKGPTFLMGCLQYAMSKGYDQLVTNMLRSSEPAFSYHPTDEGAWWNNLLAWTTAHAPKYVDEIKRAIHQANPVTQVYGDAHKMD
jgi:hypothetical protein